jgi:hypothetical protein
VRRWIIYLGEPQESVDRENGRETAMNVPLLEIANLHDEGCGVAPSILKRNNADYYLGYFENEHNEQFVLEVNRETGYGVLQSDDSGWDHKVKIYDDTIHGDLILGDGELRWLSACWVAATGRELVPPAEHEIRTWLKEKPTPKTKRKVKKKTKTKRPARVKR